MDPATIFGLVGSGLGLVKGLFGDDDEELAKQRAEQAKLEKKRLREERLMAARQARAAGSGITDPGSMIASSGPTPIRNQALDRIFGGA